MNNRYVRLFLIVVVVALAGVYLGILDHNREELLQEKNEVKLTKTEAVDFELTNWDQETVRFSQMNSDQYILINFWASWCRPCVKEIPAMIRLQGRLKDYPFTILAVNIEEDWPTIKEFFERFGGRPPFPVILDEQGQTAPAWGTEKLPETYFVAPRGKILNKFIGYAEFDSDKMVGYLTKLMEDDHGGAKGDDVRSTFDQ